MLAGRENMCAAWLVGTDAVVTGGVGAAIRSWGVSDGSFAEFKDHSKSITQIKSPQQIQTHLYQHLL